MRSFTEVCAELDDRRRITMGFERIEALLALLGNPERELRSVQVVGTNGKGTTAIALAAALQELGYPSGAYLSPHVLSYTERMMIHGEQVSEEAFARAMDEIMTLADENDIPASQFETLTVGALKIFRDAELSFSVLEAGLGARYDATSVAPSEAVVLTNVGLDHTAYLGDTVEEITHEKLASLRPDSTLILGTSDPTVVEIARDTVSERGARLVEWEERRIMLPPTLAPYAADDIRLGIRASEVVTGLMLEEKSRERIAVSVAGKLPARFEVHEVRGVPVIVDGGHNVPGLRAALRSVREVFPERPVGVVFGVLRDKDAANMLALLAREAHMIVLTRPENERATEPEWLLKEFGSTLRRGMPVRVVTYSGDALDVAVEEMKRVNGVVLVTGSLYTGVGILRGLRED